MHANFVSILKFVMGLLFVSLRCTWEIGSPNGQGVLKKNYFFMKDVDKIC